ncbi:MAG: hypothetical protein MJZ02_01310 [Paludibacteraceae bacterium]|nr:hypothetical protein [Paludibacteraceae bacterium]
MGILVVGFCLICTSDKSCKFGKNFDVPHLVWPYAQKHDSHASNIKANALGVAFLNM